MLTLAWEYLTNLPFTFDTVMNNRLLTRDDSCVAVQVEWNKGHALNHLLDSLQLEDMADVMPIYIGDDRTDEDAFAALNERSNGIGILVSSKVRVSPQSELQCQAHRVASQGKAYLPTLS